MRWIAVWRRNFLVWRKLIIAAALSNLADPLIWLFGLGYGLGSLMPALDGMSYIVFFAAGTLCTATMFTDDATVSLDQARYAVDEDPVIAVTDADRNGDASSAEEVTATLSSSSDGTGITVTLTETGVDTGVFQGPAGLTTGSSTAYSWTRARSR